MPLLSDHLRAEIHRLFENRGGDLYIGEKVTQLEHGLQCALTAREENAPSEEVLAALLHDVGHLLHNLPEDCAEQGVDDHHEELGWRWLEKRFPPEVSEPVRLHVAAKRYLCSVEPAYHAGLSEASILSLKLQGGPMSPDEAAAFRANPHHESAIRLRRRDEKGKIPGLATPSLADFLADA
jgi:phosphonate degradation associated HDIG domain protein